MTIFDRIAALDLEGWRIADRLTAKLADEQLRGTVTPGIAAFARSYTAGRWPLWNFALLTLADGSIKAAPTEYKGSVE